MSVNITNIRRIFSVAILLLAAFSCNKEMIEPEIEIAESGEYEKVTMVIPPVNFKDDTPATKLNFNFNENSLKYLWTNQDSVGIFPNTGSQIYFSMANGVGENVATFDGGGWALKKSSSYYSYFPFVASYYIDKNKIPVNYKGQVQDGNSSTEVANMGKYCYMVAKGVSDEATGNLMFSYQHLGMPFIFMIPVEAGTYTSLDVYAGENIIPVSGTMDAIALDLAIHDPKYENHLSIELKNITFNNAGTLVATAMMAPFNMSGKQLTANLTKADGTVVTSSVAGKNYSLNTAYRIRPNISVSASAVVGSPNTFELHIKYGNSTSYTVSTDVDWITLNSHPTYGDATVTFTAAENTGSSRTGHIIVSETVDNVTLQNKIQITQDSGGTSFGLGDWGQNESYEGSAQ